jgi:hypothetical protein
MLGLYRIYFYLGFGLDRIQVVMIIYSLNIFGLKKNYQAWMILSENFNHYNEGR